MQRAVKKISQLAVIKTVTWSWRTGTQPTSLTLCAPIIYNGCYWSLTSVPELVLDSFVHALPFCILSIKSFSFRGIKDDGYTGSNKLIWDTPTLYSLCSGLTQDWCGLAMPKQHSAGVGVGLYLHHPSPHPELSKRLKLYSALKCEEGSLNLVLVGLNWGEVHPLSALLCASFIRRPQLFFLHWIPLCKNKAHQS